jgi:predicted sulfurtransferase
VAGRLTVDVLSPLCGSIGHFEGALNPNTRRFSQFPEWVQQQLPMLQQKDKILMYCTGGIRCEKASAYLKHLGLEHVYQLQGGIHRYLEHFPDGGGGRFQGKNFVFDQRVAMASTDETVAGKCEQCAAPYDKVSGLRCQYCRTHVLLCERCRHDDDWVFCRDHAWLADGSLEMTAQLAKELEQQRGPGRKGKRRSLRKQLATLEQARIRATQP